MGCWQANPKCLGLEIRKDRRTEGQKDGRAEGQKDSYGETCFLVLSTRLKLARPL